MGQEEVDAVRSVMESQRLASGPTVEEFERALSSFTGARFCVATNAGTAALIASLRALDIGPGDEVIVPAFTYAATASSILAVGASPVFADVSMETCCLDPASVESAITARSSAILAVHLFGHPADSAGLEQVARSGGLAIVYDAAQAIGSSYGTQPVGGEGTVCLSFHPSKNMTTGEGGAVLTDDPRVAERVRAIGNQGLSAPEDHDRFGYNFRMNEIAAAIGLVQLRRLPSWNQARRENANFYDSNLEAVRTPPKTPGITHSYHQYTVRVTGAVSRDQVLEQLGHDGIEARAYYRRPLHLQPAFANCKSYDLSNTAELARTVMSIPVHQHLDRSSLHYVAERVNLHC